jgi:class 3 adenylate cyclase
MESSGRTLVCSVLFLDIVEYSKKPVAEQLQIKQEFNRVLTRSLEHVPARDRIILDTGDGAAVTFMGDPEDALFAAMAMRDGAGALAVRCGVNLGPVRLVKDLNSQLNIIGDGINVAQRVMSFARPGQLLVSRSFYEVVSCLSRDYANLFHHEGARTDKHVREHDVYSIVGGTPSGRRLSDTLTQSFDGEAPPGWFARSGPLGLRRSALVAAGVVFLAIVAGGVTARTLMEPAAPPVAAAAVAPPAAPASPAPPAQKTEAPPPKKVVARTEKKPERTEKRVERPEKPVVASAAPAGPGRVELAVAPWGEVLVNGKSRGVSPPLRVLELPAGRHTVEIRNSTFPAHVEQVQVKAGEAVRIRHRFK